VTDTDLERFREHSILLNTLGWRIAEALGDIPAGATSHEADEAADLTRLIASREQLLEAVAAQHGQIDAVLELHRPVVFWIGYTDERLWPSREAAQTDVDEHWNSHPFDDGEPTEKPVPYEFRLCEHCMHVAWEYDDGESVADNGYGAASHWPCATALAVGVAA